jgi:hypothetical protein
VSGDSHSEATEQETVSSRWRLLGGDSSALSVPGAEALLAEGQAAAPAIYRGEQVVEFLPRRRVIGKCRLCGRTEPLTREHIPPQGSGNTQRVVAHSIDDWLQSESVDLPATGRVQQGGIWGYALCSDCNSYTGTHYGAEYQRWSALTTQVMDSLPPPGVLNQQTEPLGWNLALGGDPAARVHPGAFVRQVMSCFCSLSGSWDIAERHPELRRAILDQSTEALPTNLELGLHLFFGPRVRITGPQLQVQPAAGIWRWLMELAYPPFGFLMVLASNIEEAGLGLMMRDWVHYPPEQAMLFEGLVEVGFGWTPYPGDYRSRAAIEAEAAGSNAGD